MLEFVATPLNPFVPLHLFGFHDILIDTLLHTLHCNLVSLLFQQLVEVQPSFRILYRSEILSFPLWMVPSLPLLQFVLRKQLSFKLHELPLVVSDLFMVFVERHRDVWVDWGATTVASKVRRFPACRIQESLLMFHPTTSCGR